MMIQKNIQNKITSCDKISPFIYCSNFFSQKDFASIFHALKGQSYEIYSWIFGPNG